jgi:indole-3-glycerol phosphate synthase
MGRMLCISSHRAFTIAKPVARRKQRQLSVELDELGDEGLELRLQSATESPARPDHRLARAISEAMTAGRPALVAEVGRSDGGDAATVANLATSLVECGVDAIAVRTDSDDSPAGLADLFAVIRAVGNRVPVLQRDWILHLLQVASAKEAGAAGVLGAVASVTGPRGTPVLSSFAAAVGLDCPVEVGWEGEGPARPGPVAAG